MELAKIVGENLKAARRSKGLTQKEVAETMLMTQQQYSRFENGAVRAFRRHAERFVRNQGLKNSAPPSRIVTAAHFVVYENDILSSS